LEFNDCGGSGSGGGLTLEEDCGCGKGGDVVWNADALKVAGADFGECMALILEGRGYVG